MDTLIENWEAIIASALVVIASIDKVALIAFKTLRNIIDAWSELFTHGKSNERI